jgi:GNAT superfamily N-acetyltransferase
MTAPVPPDADWTRRFVASQRAIHPGLTQLLLHREPAGNVVLSRMEVRRADRGAGVGEAVMQALCAAADAAGDVLALTPDRAYGGSVTRLRAWCARHNFRRNAGRRRDFSTREAMIRLPAAGRAVSEDAQRCALIEGDQP